MESLFKIVVFFIFIFFVLMGTSALFGYSCTSCNNVDDISNNPCIPVLSNGKTNPHYRNNWNSCVKTCVLKGNPNLNIKTCECFCE